jgi:DegV family protein with EDD domain
MIANRLAELIAEGRDFEDICRAIEEYRRRTYLLYALQSIENLVKNGRVSRLAGSIAGILGIRVLGIASDAGTVELLHKLRGKLSLYDKMIVEMLERGYNGGRVIIAHCLNPEMAGYLAKEIRARFPKSSVELMPSGGLCSYYAERGGILLGFEGRPREA